METERILMTGWNDERIAALKALQAEPAVMKLVPGNEIAETDNPTSRERESGYWHDQGFGKWALEEKGTGEFMGFIGISFPGHWPSPEISWTLGQKFWNKGYATEAARHALTYGFTESNLERVISVAIPENIASQRVMQKLNMELTEDTICPLRHIPVIVYAATRTTWLQ